jgi:putative membrane protein
VTSLVVCVDRDGAVTSAADASGPVTGWDAVRDLVTEIGLDDPEDSRVNCLLEALRVTRDLRAEGEESVVAVVTGMDPSAKESGESDRTNGSDGTGGTDGIDTDGGTRSGRALGGAVDTVETDADAGTDADTAADIEAGTDPMVADPEPGSNESVEADRRAEAGSRTAVEPVGSGDAGDAGGGGVGPDRVVARQVDALIARYEPVSAVVVVGSAEDERLVPIVESRVRVDAVDRVVVRQARDIESTYYLMKQFLADEELRGTVLVPIGFGLLVFPLLVALTDRFASALAAIAGVTGFFLLYKGLGFDERAARAAGELREALYSGQVSIVTYVVAAGLALVGVFAGGIAASATAGTGTGAGVGTGIGAGSGSGSALLLLAMRFAFEGVPWFAAAALVASAGRLLDDLIRTDRARSSSLNLPFGVLAVGFVLRGFAAYFLERAGAIGSLAIPSLRLGAVSVRGFALAPGTRLAVFVICGVIVSLVGVQVAVRADTDDSGSDGLFE